MKIYALEYYTSSSLARLEWYILFHKHEDAKSYLLELGTKVINLSIKMDGDTLNVYSDNNLVALYRIIERNIL